MNIPNLITIGRIMLVPLVFWLLISGQTQLAFCAFVLAGVSDGIDGYIAKHFNLSTELGAYLDPLADKLLLVSISWPWAFGRRCRPGSSSPSFRAIS